jgi:hypothetical protein
MPTLLWSPLFIIARKASEHGDTRAAKDGSKLKFDMARVVGGVFLPHVGIQIACTEAFDMVGFLQRHHAGMCPLAF